MIKGVLQDEYDYVLERYGFKHPHSDGGSAHIDWVYKWCLKRFTPSSVIVPPEFIEYDFNLPVTVDEKLYKDWIIFNTDEGQHWVAGVRL